MAWQIYENSLFDMSPVLVRDGVQLAAHLRQIADEIELDFHTAEVAPSQIGPPLHIHGRIVCLCILSQSRVAAARASDKVLSTLTWRQREILDQMTKGHTAKSIAAMLGIHPRTVEAHVHHIHQKAGTHRSVELMEIAFSKLD